MGYAARRQRQSIEELCLPYAKKAVKYLVDLIGDDTAPVKERRLAADSVLDRAYGKSVDRLAIAAVAGSDSTRSPELLTTEQLITALSRQVTPGIELNSSAVGVQASPEIFSDFSEIDAPQEKNIAVDSGDIADS
jgi:hypothetical protein